MLKKLGNLVESKPIMVIAIIIVITLLFSALLPSIEFKTDFKDFLPDDEVVEANWDIIEKFGKSQMMLFLYIEAQESDSILDADALKEILYIQEELTKSNSITDPVGIVTAIDVICILEFGEPFKNCTNEQISTVIKDVFNQNNPNKIKGLNVDDENERVDYNAFPRISKGKSVDEVDIKNFEVTYDQNNFIFTFEVYDLSSFESRLKSPIPFVNVLEWYIDFENEIKPDPRLDIDYKISVCLEPKHSLWEIGKGFIPNLRDIFNHIKNRELFNSYKKQVYLWLKAPGQDMSIPLSLDSSVVNFNTNDNKIELKVSKDELGKFGLGTKYGIYELPAKITNLKAGTRYYKNPIGKLPYLRITANTSFLFDLLEKIRNNPRLSEISEKLISKYGDITWEDFDLLFDNINDFITLPDQFALKDIEQNWIYLDKAPENEVSEELLFIRPEFFNEIKTSSRGFLSKDYNGVYKASSSLMILYLNSSWDNQESIDKTAEIIDSLKRIDNVNNFVKVEATGDTVISSSLNDITMEANTFIMPMIFVMIVLVLFFFFRRISYMVLPLLTLLISVVWLFGTMVLFNIPFTTISVALVPLIMGLGVDYSVHLFHNYRLELSLGKNPAKAMKNSVIEIGNAMFLAMITTLIAFMSFLTATVPPLRDFGLLLGIGIFYTFITTITFQASIRYLLDKRKKKFKKQKKEAFKLNKLMGKVSKTVLSHQKKILASILIVTIVASVGATQLKTGFDLNSFLPEENPAMETYNKMQTNFPYVAEGQEYILIKGNVAQRQTLIGIKNTYDNFKDDSYIVRNADGSIKADSIYTIISDAVKNNASLISEFNIDENTNIPKTDRDVRNLYNYLLEEVEYKTQTSIVLHKSDSGKFDSTVIRISVSIKNSVKNDEDQDNDYKILTDELQNDLEEYNAENVIVTGPYVLTYTITNSLNESQVLSTSISIILATIVLIIAFRRFSLGIITIIPVGISIIWILGTMYFIGYSLDVLTITVTSLTIGIGIDYSIHTTERFRYIADKTGNINMALSKTIEKTGGALLIAALTTTLGFGMLLFAPMPPQQKFGVIMVLTIVYSLITSILVLPLILAYWAKSSKKKKGYIISSNKVDKKYKSEIETEE